MAGDLEFLALMASRICHDLISPIGAINNGVEILEEEAGPKGDPAMRQQALELIAQAAQNASAKLGFCRLAFGAGGGAAAQVDMREVAKVAKAYMAGSKATLHWSPPAEAMARDHAKIALILIAIAQDALVRGGEVMVEPKASSLTVTARAERRIVNDELRAALTGQAPADPKAAPAAYAAALARALGGELKVVDDGNETRFTLKIS